MAWVMLWFGADRHWLGTLLEFAPRWPWMAPVGLIIVIALMYDRRLLVVGAIATLIWVGPIAGLCVSISGTSRASDLRILTLNTDGIAEPVRVMKLVQEKDIDIVCLQECRAVHLWKSGFPADWTTRDAGQYVIASRFKVSEIETLKVPETGGHTPPACKCKLQTAAGEIELVNAHAYSPRRGLNAVRFNRRDGLPELRKNMLRRTAEHKAIAQWSGDAPAIIAGDLNQSTGSAAFVSTWRGFSDCFSSCGVGWGSTFFTRWHSLRIDHILISDDLEAISCSTLENVGSAHRPVMATIRIK